MAEKRLLKDITYYGDGRYVSDVLYNNSTRSIYDYKKMVRHPMIHLGLSIIKLNLADIPPIWEGEDDEIVLKCKAVFEPIWKDLVYQACEMLDFGWKSFEIRYDIGEIKYEDEDGNTQKYEGLILKAPRSLDGETIDILIHEDTGSFRGIVQDGVSDSECLAEDGKALLFTNNFSSGNYYGIAEVEYVYTYWYDSILERQFYMRWLERKGMGTYVGHYPPGKDEDGTDHADVMISLLDSILEGTSVAIPSAIDKDSNEQQWKIELLEPTDKTDSFIQKAQYNNEMILRGLVIPDQALTQNQTGSYASTEVYHSSLIERKQDILNRVVENINKYMVKKYVEFAFGADVDVTVKAGKLDDKTKDVALDITKKLIENGSKKPKHEWLNDKSGIPLEDEEEEPEIDPMFNGQDIEDEVQEEVEEDADKLEMADTGKKSVESKINFSELSASLDTIEGTFTNNMLENLTQQEDRIKNYINKNYDEMFNKPLEFAKSIEIFVSKIKNITKDFMTDTYDLGYTTIKESVEGTVNMAESEKSYISFRVGNVVTKLVTDLQNSIQYIVENDISNNIALNVIFQKISEVFDRFKKTRIPTISAMESSSTISRATNDYYTSNQKLVKSGKLPQSASIQRFKSSAIMDRRTTDLCKKLNGVVVTADSPIYRQYQTPRHFMCRSVWIPVTNADITNPRIKGTDISVDKKGKPYTEKTIISDKLGDSASQQMF